MATDGDETPAGPRAAEPHPAPAHRIRPCPAVPATGTVLCVFDGSAAAQPRLRLAAAAASAAGRRLLVVHVEGFSTGFWSAAFTGSGACLGPAERLLITTAEAAFAAAVECLVDSPTRWDFAAVRGGWFPALRSLVDAHDAAVVVVPRRNRLFRRLARRPGLTVLAAS